MKNTVVALFTLCAVGLFASTSSAATITFEFAVQFSNSTQPGGPAPWLTASFNDATAGSGYDVRGTFTASGLIGSEFISGMYFNLDPNINPLQVTANLVSQPPNTVEAIGLVPNAFQADGDGLYDILIALNTASAFRFNDDETVVIDFNLTTGTLLAQHFNFLAAPGGGNGPFYAAAHLQGIGPTGALSTWIADGNGGVGDCPGCTPTPDVTPIPEPTTMLLLGSGLLAVARYTKKRKTINL